MKKLYEKPEVEMLQFEIAEPITYDEEIPDWEHSEGVGGFPG